VPYPCPAGFRWEGQVMASGQLCSFVAADLGTSCDRMEAAVMPGCVSCGLRTGSAGEQQLAGREPRARRRGRR
jgi:hypothetical protein